MDVGPEQDRGVSRSQTLDVGRRRPASSHQRTEVVGSNPASPTERTLARQGLFSSGVGGTNGCRALGTSSEDESVVPVAEVSTIGGSAPDDSQGLLTRFLTLPFRRVRLCVASPALARDVGGA